MTSPLFTGQSPSPRDRGLDQILSILHLYMILTRVSSMNGGGPLSTRYTRIPLLQVGVQTRKVEPIACIILSAGPF